MKRKRGPEFVQARVTFRGGPGAMVQHGQRFKADDPFVLERPSMFEPLPPPADVRIAAAVSGDVAAPASFMESAPESAPTVERPAAAANKSAWLNYLLTLEPKETVDIPYGDVDALAEMTKTEMIACCDALEA